MSLSSVIKFCHSEACGGHFSSRKTTKFWNTISGSSNLDNCCYHCLILTLIFHLKVLINFFFFFFFIIITITITITIIIITTVIIIISIIIIIIIIIIILIIVVTIVVYNLYN